MLFVRAMLRCRQSTPMFPSALIYDMSSLLCLLPAVCKKIQLAWVWLPMPYTKFELLGLLPLPAPAFIYPPCVHCLIRSLPHLLRATETSVSWRSNNSSVSAMATIEKCNTWQGRGKRSVRDVPPSSSSTTVGESSVDALSPRFSSIARFNAVLSRFSEKHKKLARSTGFGAFVDGINFASPDHPFTIWLMSKVDSMQRSLKITPSIRIPIFSEYINLVFGLPCNGKEVWDPCFDKSSASHDRVTAFLSVTDGDCLLPSSAALHILETMNYDDDSSFDVDRFKIAFVVYVVSVLVDDDSPKSTDSTNFWPAILNTSGICDLNWSSFFLESVMSSCVACRRSVRLKQPVHVPVGVSIFLQV